LTQGAAGVLGRYESNRPQFWLDLQSQHDLAVVAR
jgi:plasmid maintenance system antidote protein VapI